MLYCLLVRDIPVFTQWDSRLAKQGYQRLLIEVGKISNQLLFTNDILTHEYDFAYSHLQGSASLALHIQGEGSYDFQATSFLSLFRGFTPSMVASQGETTTRVSIIEKS
jgi:hypothetical protein